MPIDRRQIIGGAIGLSVTGAAATALPRAAAAQDTMTQWPPAEHFKLWPGRAPNSPKTLPRYAPSMNGQPPRRELWLRGVAEPVVGVYRPAQPNGRAIVSIPGGGYEFISVENEGINVARTFCPRGYTVFVLAYRLPGEGWLDPQDVPLQDAQRAMRLIRADAAKYGVDPNHVGVCGFSAGGLLAADIATAWYDPVYPPLDAADKQSARPAFAGMIYPVISGDLMRVGKYGAARFDAQRRAGEGTPPLFLAIALDDPVVPIDEPLSMMQAARAAKVPVEAHFFQEGGHGFGPAYLAADLPGADWPELFHRWIGRALAKAPA